MTKPLFQHRHYCRIAEIIANMGDQHRDYVVGFFSVALKGTNPSYDLTRFADAASGKPKGRDKHTTKNGS